MKIKKICLIIPLVLLLTGCTATANIVISDNIVSEEIIIDDQTTPRESFRDYIPVYYNDEVADTEPDVKEDNKVYYKKAIKDNKIYYSYSYRIANYNNASTMKNVFDSSVLSPGDRDGVTELYTSKGRIHLFDIYPTLTRLEINIKTDLEVVDNNADSTSDNIYTWIFTPDTADKSIHLETRNYQYKRLHPSESYTESNESNKQSNNEPVIITQKESLEEKKAEERKQLIIAALILLAFITIVFIIIRINIKKNR